MAGTSKPAAGPVFPVTIRDHGLARLLCGTQVRAGKARGSIAVCIPGAGPKDEKGKSTDLTMVWAIDPDAWNQGSDQPPKETA